MKIRKETLQKMLALLDYMLRVGFSSHEARVALNAVRELWGLEPIKELLE